MNDGAIRNLDQLQESDEERKTPRVVTAAFVMLGGACIVFAALALGGRRSKTDVPKADPLGDLVTQQRAHAAASASTRPTDLSTRDVTFPGILSDGDKPTTALAAVRGDGARRDPGALLPGASRESDLALAHPPPASDRLPVVPLPAQNVLEASPVVTRPRDALTRAASDSGQIVTPATAAAPSGKEGGYQLQVSSFRTQAEADAFSNQLRARGHKAYTVEANVPGRGKWFRVRIGPFSSQVQAANYRATFEAREHVVPFIVPPAGK